MFYDLTEEQINSLVLYLCYAQAQRNLAHHKERRCWDVELRKALINIVESSDIDGVVKDINDNENLKSIKKEYDEANKKFYSFSRGINELKALFLEKKNVN